MLPLSTKLCIIWSIFDKLLFKRHQKSWQVSPVKVQHKPGNNRMADKRGKNTQKPNKSLPVKGSRKGGKRQSKLNLLLENKKHTRKIITCSLARVAAEVLAVLCSRQVFIFQTDQAVPTTCRHKPMGCKTFRPCCARGPRMWVWLMKTATSVASMQAATLHHSLFTSLRAPRTFFA